jgi:protein-S-isoprenylcysteine O-methyltransferase Ste14
VLRNVPLPEANLVGIAVGAGLHWIRPSKLPWSRPLQRFVGWSIVAAGSFIVVRSLNAVATTDLTKPQRLVTIGPYALSRNPMYVGWALVQLGIGVAGGSGWILATLPAAGVWIHRDVVREERRLREEFGDEYERYRARVGRYFPKF